MKTIVYVKLPLMEVDDILLECDYYDSQTLLLKEFDNLVKLVSLVINSNLPVKVSLSYQERMCQLKFPPKGQEVDV